MRRTKQILRLDNERPAERSQARTPRIMAIEHGHVELRREQIRCQSDTRDPRVACAPVSGNVPGNSRARGPTTRRSADDVAVRSAHLLRPVALRVRIAAATRTVLAGRQAVLKVDLVD